MAYYSSANVVIMGKGIFYKTKSKKFPVDIGKFTYTSDDEQYVEMTLKITDTVFCKEIISFMNIKERVATILNKTLDKLIELE